MARVTALAVGLIACALGACELPPGDPAAADLASALWFDAGLADANLLLLDGNLLPLDGGVAFAHLVFTVTARDTGLPIPSRVIFRPVPGAGFADSITEGTPDPLGPGGATGAVVGPGVLGSTEGVLLVAGQGVVPVPPGEYTLLITRGPEYEAIEVPVTVAAGEVRHVAATLDRTVDTGGWLAADLHVHVGRSLDSTLPNERRVISMTTNGVEVIVSTDHDVHTDLGPAAAALGYGPDVVGTVVGNEFTFAEGHGGAYPVVFRPELPGGGAPPWEDPCTSPFAINCMPAERAFPRMRAQIPGTTVVTVHHPFWPDSDLGYFTNIGWGAGTANPPPAPLPTAGLFDAFEVLNGYQTNDPAQNALVADWFFLLNQGYRVTALGSSDTHRLNWVRAGFPRTWLRLPNDRPGDTTGALLAEAIRRGRAIASTGPFVTLTVDGAAIGDTVVPKTPGVVSISVTVDAPAWIEVDTVRVYVSGVLRRSFAVPQAGQRPLFRATFDEPVKGRAWIVAFASGARPLPPDVVGEYARAAGGQMRPWAITNPVFVGDGKSEPPRAPASRPVPVWPWPRKRPPGAPKHCDPSERSGVMQAPLDDAARLMPLLYP